MRFPLTLSLLALLVSGPAASQNFTDRLCGILITQFGPVDLVLNKPLLDAIAGEPGCATELQKALGEAFVNVQAITTDLPAPHPAGTFQIHLRIDINIRGAQSELRDKAVDAVVAHMKRRLDQLLYQQPLEDLTKRREEMSRRLAELQGQRATMLARAEAATQTVAMLQQQKRELEQQLLGVRIDITTELLAREHLEAMLAESTKRRDEMRNKIADRNAGLTALMSRLNDLTARSASPPPEVNEKLSAEKLRAEIANLQAAVQTVRSEIDQLEDRARDEQRVLTVVLEQMPASALATQRAKARQQSLEAEQKSLGERLDAADRERTAAAHYEANAERLAIDGAVCRTLLTEIQGKLARLQPVHYELMRQDLTRPR